MKTTLRQRIADRLLDTPPHLPHLSRVLYGLEITEALDAPVPHAGQYTDTAAAHWMLEQGRLDQILPIDGAYDRLVTWCETVAQYDDASWDELGRYLEQRASALRALREFADQTEPINHT